MSGDLRAFKGSPLKPLPTQSSISKKRTWHRFLMISARHDTTYSSCYKADFRPKPKVTTWRDAFSAGVPQDRLPPPKKTVKWRKGTDSECNTNFNPNKISAWISLHHAKRKYMYLNFKWGAAVFCCRDLPATSSTKGWGPAKKSR